MPTEKLSMRKIKEVLKLHYEDSLSNRDIARRLNIGAASVSRCLTRTKAAKIVWPLTDEWTEEKIHTALYPITSKNPAHEHPDFGKVH
ncbi:MAG: IS21 family transposase, partial [Gammaproteobacteria bacterium]|nr:IS21 family transposase [Gammaproteobacteria bacterium]